MNLSPSWIERLARHGFEAVHWSSIGAVTAPDSEILKWANEHGFVLITNDLDFSAILAAGAVTGPSVIQLRTQDLLSDAAVSIVSTHSKRTERPSREVRSCRLTKLEGASECCLCAIRRKPHDRNERRARFRSPGSPVTNLASRNGGGTTGLGGVVPLFGALIGNDGRRSARVDRETAGSSDVLAMSKFGPLSDERRFSPPVSCERGRRQQRRGTWGRERPPLPVPDYGPAPSFRGSLTPQAACFVVRQNRALRVIGECAARCRRWCPRQSRRLRTCC
jgi:predicted nuclease of predicted toxin-antitoxin system